MGVVGRGVGGGGGEGDDVGEVLDEHGDGKDGFCVVVCCLLVLIQ